MTNSINLEPDAILSWARAELARHRAAIPDLEATIRAVEKAKAERGGVPNQPASAVPPPLNGTKKRALLQVIADSPKGLSTAGTIKAATARGIAGFRTANVSPKLSAAGKDGLLALTDGVWTITEKGRNYLASPKG